MQLLTAELRTQLPPLYSQKNNTDSTVHAKFFCPWLNWSWFPTEGSQPEDPSARSSSSTTANADKNTGQGDFTLPCFLLSTPEAHQVDPSQADPVTRSSILQMASR
jgi:hypothetical protein